MTAEIGVMNKSGVALAADSAATLRTSFGHKINNNVNKLFALSKCQPIGIMVYGNSVFMDIPWEIIIKEYRAKLGEKVFHTLDMYAHDFIRFLTSASLKIPKETQLNYLTDIAFEITKTICYQIIECINELIKTNKEVTEGECNNIAKKYIDSWYWYLRNQETNDGFEHVLFDTFIVTHKDLLNKVIDNVFENVSWTLNRENLYRIIFFCISKSVYNDDKRYDIGSFSGIVFAGYGKKELYPSIKSYKIECIIDNYLKYNIDIGKTATIGQEVDASIIPFAQQDVVATFINGIEPSLQLYQKNYLKEVFENYNSIIIEAINDSGINLDEESQKSLNDISEKLQKQYNEAILGKIYEWNVEPILTMIKHLPKDELGNIAETMVNLTSFKRKVSMEAETVGGPVDVAVITKGDGFIWLKRKHYFDAELNNMFFENYYKEVNFNDDNRKRRKGIHINRRMAKRILPKKV